MTAEKKEEEQWEQRHRRRWKKRMDLRLIVWPAAPVREDKGGREVGGCEWTHVRTWLSYVSAHA